MFQTKFDVLMTLHLSLIKFQYESSDKNFIHPPLSIDPLHLQELSDKKILTDATSSILLLSARNEIKIQPNAWKHHHCK